ncbi:MAG: hypothetical protein KAY24_12975, partial [Candidatus Eisenbacteria sp.]|nr:hypothetical protein [Candidatus Eisenbacteria bacterium]
MSNQQVGVNLVEGQSVSPISGVTTAVSAILGNFERGPLNIATLVTSMAQFQSIFGAAPAAGSTSWYSVKAFFAKVGSGSLYIIRVASSTAASAAHTFKDRDGVTPADALKIEGDNEGTWGNDLAVQIEDNAILTTTLAENVDASAVLAVLTSIEGLEVGSDVSFYNGANTEYIRVISIDHANNTIHWTGGLTNAYTTANGVITSQEFKLTVSVKAVEVEEWAGLSMNPDVSFYVEKLVASDYILCTDVLAAPVNTHEDQPVAIAATALTSGADGLDDVEAADYEGVQANKT